QADTAEGEGGRKRMIQLVRERGASAAADEMMPKLVCEATSVGRPEVVEKIRKLILTNSTETIVGAITALMTRPDSTSLLSEIHCPTLVLVGDQDSLTPPAFSEDIRRGITNAELVVVPDAGHMSNMEQPAAFNAAVARFLDNRV